MALGDTIAIRPQSAPGTWNLSLGEQSINLSERARVSVEGGGMLSPGQARLLTLSLGPRARGESLSTLRRDLAPFLRPEASQLWLTYTGLARTVWMPCTYVEGLDSLRIVLAGKASTWRAYTDSVSGMVEESVPLNQWVSIDGVGTASSPPLFVITYGAGGSLTKIENNVVGLEDTYYAITFGGDQSGVGGFQVDVAQVAIVPGTYMGLVLPGSQFSTFRIVGGVENQLKVTGSSLSYISYGYYPRFWSWEDADVA